MSNTRKKWLALSALLLTITAASVYFAFAWIWVHGLAFWSISHRSDHCDQSLQISMQLSEELRQELFANLVRKKASGPCFNQVLDSIRPRDDRFIQVLKEISPELEMLVQSDEGHWRQWAKEVCRGSSLCADVFVHRLEQSKDEKERSLWHELILSCESAAWPLVYERLTAWADLGFTRSDSDSDIELKITNWVEIGAEVMSDQFEWTGPENLPQKWRLAVALANKKNWPLVQKAVPALLDQPIPVGVRIAAIRYGLEADISTQDWGSHLTSLLKNIPQQINDEQQWTPFDQEQLLTMLALTHSVPTSNLNEADMDHFLNFMDQQLGADHTLVQQTKDLLKKSKWVPRGWRLAQNLKSFDTAKKELRNSAQIPSLVWPGIYRHWQQWPKGQVQELLSTSKNPTAQVLLASLLPLKKTKIKSKTALQTIAQLKDQAKDPLWSTQLEILEAHFSPKSKEIDQAEAALSNHFACTPPWIELGKSIAERGPKYPTFGRAIVAMLGCDEQGLIDSTELSKWILSREAHAPVVKALRQVKAKPEVVARLQVIYSESNRTPGSSLPPKIKRSSQ